MKKYLGKKEIPIEQTEYALYSKIDFIQLWIKRYGSIDGSHHKQWLIDQIMRITKGTKVRVEIAEWDNGDTEVRLFLDKPSPEYLKWAEQNKFDEGIAP